MQWDTQGFYNSAAGFVPAKDVFLLGVGKKHPLDFREAPPPKHECPPLPTKQPAFSNCRHTDTHSRPPTPQKRSGSDNPEWDSTSQRGAHVQQLSKGEATWLSFKLAMFAFILFFIFWKWKEIVLSQFLFVFFFLNICSMYLQALKLL